jgi:dihydroxy-acid dehydratase
VQNGDIVSIDPEAGTIELEVDPIELENRRRHWTPRPHNYNSGAIWKFAQLVGPAHLGALTHPGFKAETHIYADL